MSRVVITGCRGYVGRNLDWYLMKEGYEVVGCDRLIAGRTVGWLADNLKLYSPETVIHCAAFSNIEAEGNYGELIRDNLVELESIATACRRYGVKFVYFSSSGVWQKSEIGPYVMSKKFGEMMISEIIKNPIIIRPSNIVGAAWEDGFDSTKNGHLLPRMYECSRDGKVFGVFGNGDQTRDFIHIKYLCKRLQEEIESPSGCLVEACSGKVHSVKEVIEEWRKIVDPDLDVLFEIGLRRSDPFILAPTVFNCGMKGLAETENSLEIALRDYRERLNRER